MMCANGNEDDAKTEGRKKERWGLQMKLDDKQYLHAEVTMKLMKIKKNVSVEIYSISTDNT